MRKQILALGLFFFLTIPCLAMPGFDNVYEKIKDQAFESLSKTFNRPVKIGKASGRIIGQIILNDVSIGEDFYFEKFIIDFNPVQYAIHKGDINLAITKLTLVGGEIKVYRNKDGKINLFDIMKPGDKGGPPFKSKINIKDINVKFKDEAGLPYKNKKIETEFLDTSGIIDLSKFPKIAINITAQTEGKNNVKVIGYFNPQDKKTEIKIVTNHLSLNKWGPYFIPFFNFKDGQANVICLLKSDSISLDLKGLTDGFSFDIKGDVYKNLDLNLDFKNVDINKIKKAFDRPITFEASGIVDANVAIKGAYNNPKILLAILIKDGKIFQKKIKGRAKLLYQDKVLNMQKAEIETFNGNMLASGFVSLKDRVPLFLVSGKALKLSLIELANKTPGIEGFLNATFKISGTTEGFSVDLSGDFSNALLLGQPIKNLEAKIDFYKGALNFKKLNFSSDLSYFLATGTLSSSMEFNLHTNASGVRILGHGVLGPMNALVRSFSGDLLFSLNKEFFSAPIKNLAASGSVEIVAATIGQQKIDHIAGCVYLDSGKIEVADMFLEEGKSKITISGQTGIGVDTNLLILSKRLELKDLKIIGQVFPEFSDNQGQINASIKISGHLSKIEKINDISSLNFIANCFGKNLLIGSTQVSLLSVEVTARNNQISLDQAYIKTPSSEIRGYVKHSVDNNIDSKFKGYINVEDIAHFTSKYNIFSGYGPFDFSLHGKEQNFSGVLKFDFSKIKSGKILFDHLNGAMSLKGNKISFLTPLIVLVDKNQANCLGDIYLDDDIPKSSMNMSIILQKGDLKGLLNLLLTGYEEIKHNALSNGSFKIKIKGQTFTMPFFGNKGINYKTVDLGKFIKAWDTLIKELSEYKISRQLRYDNIDGEINASISIFGKISDPILNVKAEVKNLKVENYKFENFSAFMKADSKTVFLQSAKFFKSGGLIDASGDYDAKSTNINLKLIAKDMPVDILNVISNKDFSGKFNAGLKIGGNVSKPLISSWFATSRINLPDVSFDKVEGILEFENDKFFVKNFKVLDGDKVSVLLGYFDKNGDFELSATLEGKVIGLMNAFTDQINLKKGDVTGFLKIGSKDGEISTYGNVYMSEGAFRINLLKSDIENIALSVEADGRHVFVRNLSGDFYGENKASSYMALYGDVDWNDKKIKLYSSDSNFYLNLNNIYQGDVSLKNVRLEGTFDNVKLSATVFLNDGMIFVPNFTANPKGSTSLQMPLVLDLNLNILKNVYITAGNVATVNLSNILMNMEIYGERIIIYGNALAPDIYGKVIFRRGTLNIFNRDFSLLNAGQLKSFYAYDLSKMSDNYAEFRGGISPNLNILALTKVNDVNSAVVSNASATSAINTNTSSSNKEIVVISHVAGVPSSIDKVKTLTIKFDAFAEDTTTSPSTYKQLSYSEDDIKVLLLPNFIRSAVGLGKSSDIDTNAVVADYLNSRLQTVLFVGVERQIEKALGLESLTLQYNFGRDLRQALGAKDTTGLEKQTFAVGFVKGFFDKFFIDVRYSQFSEYSTLVPNTNKEFFNYQVSYRLTPVVSISYYREPLTLNDPISGPAKTSLNLIYSF